MADAKRFDSSGIEVDEAAAYFGVTQSSDALYSMLGMPRREALQKFFELLSDIVLRPGDFDFEAASERMQCEGGEIYYLVAGHLGLLSMADPLHQALGMPDSSGEVSKQQLSGIDQNTKTSLEKLADPMKLMKLFAVAQQTGSSDEVLKYLDAVENMLGNVAGSIDSLVALQVELDTSLNASGQISPISMLSSGHATVAQVTIPKAPPVSTATSATTSSAPIEPVKSQVSEDKMQTVVPLPSSVPLPAAPSLQSTPTSPTSTLPLPASKVELPVVAQEKATSKQVDMENDRAILRATQDAFSGAFSSQLFHAEEPALEDLDDIDPMEVLLNDDEEYLSIEPVQEVQQEADEFVSAAEHFIAADTDGSGALDVEELAKATGTSLEEAARLHAQADTDGDGVVSLSEFIASPAADKTSNLPKPVAPVRKPLSQNSISAQHGTQQSHQQMSQQPTGQQPWQQRPMQHQQGFQPSQQQPMNQQAWQQRPMQQQYWQQPTQQPMQQGWNQPQAPLVQPTIRSGVHCRGCGIGLDPYWRFCPVCGQQNGGY